MAAPEGINWGSKVGDYGRIGIYRSETKTATTVSGTIELWFWSKYSVSDTNNTLYFDNRSSSGSASTSKGSCNINTTIDTGSGWSTSNQKKLWSTTYSYNRGTSASTRYLYAKLTNVDRVGGTMTASTTFEVPALTSYSVKYNANGGSGAPSTQTKYYGKTLTLSSTTPTRTGGYTFVGWGTSTTDTSSNYSAGGSYTANAAITLYAIWKKTITLTYNANGGSPSPSAQSATIYNATETNTFTVTSSKPTRTGYSFLGWNESSTATSATYLSGDSIQLNNSDTLYAVWKKTTYTVKYNANGGENAPGNQTKTYGTALELSTVIPTRDKYKFVGWGSSASTKTVLYEPGENYVANANITLYAIWESAYVRPRIFNFTAKRCESDGTISVTGTRVLVSLECEFDISMPVNQIGVDIEYENADLLPFPIITSIHPNAEVSPERGANYFRMSEIIGSDMFPLYSDSTYILRVTVEDMTESSTIVTTVHSTKFTQDFLAGGNGVAFGKAAELDNVCDIAFQTRFFGGILHPVLEPDTDLNDVRTPNTYVGTNVSTYNYGNCPLTSGTFTLEVVGMGEEGQVKQKLTYCHKTDSRTWERIYYSSDWGEWVCVSDFKGRLLWSGTYYMLASQTAPLSETISKQRSGIVLVFGAYEGGERKNEHFECQFVPKYMLTQYDGAGYNCHLSTSDFSYIGTKYVYIYDDKIVGHDTNNLTGTKNGVTFANNHWVLRYVIGV